MKTRMFAVVFAFLCSLIVVNRAGAQGCVPTTNYSNYSSQSFDDSNFNFYQTVTTDGYASMDTEYCPGARYATHTPYVTNSLTEPNGTVHGGTSSGASGCVNCYIAAQSNLVIVGVPGVVYTNDIGGWVYCSVAGTFWSVTNSGTSRFIKAYFQCTNWTGGQCAVNNGLGQRPYARCNPQGDACDQVEMGTSPLADGSWPRYVLMNGVLVNLPGEIEVCLVGHHGTRADKCISPDPNP
jgi:hypothetical protein